jgi:hypothetical protein
LAWTCKQIHTQLAGFAGKELDSERNYMRSFFLFCLLLGSAAIAVFGQTTNIVLEPNAIHLGNKSVSSFPTAARKPNGPQLERSFEAQSNPVEWTLRLKQQNVADDWGVEINGRAIARLGIGGSERVAHFSIPARTLVDGTNLLSIVPREATNDVLISQIEIVPKRMRDLLKLAHVVLNVTEMNGQTPVPARVTIVSSDNKHADLYNVQPDTTTWRKGVFYSLGKPVEFDLPEGDWVVSATRGMEWGRAQMKLRTFIGQQARLTLPLPREVDTSGFVAVDTHSHTYTFSGHGDASVDDRVVTLAGEGIEMPIACDHNHFTDYKARQDERGASQFFTSVIGDEVTTGNGHFNAFPFAPDGEVPDAKLKDWVKLVADIRAKGAKFVILNHPRWPGLTNSPFAIWGLNRGDGTRTNSFPFTFDAMELMNAGSPQKDAEFVLRDWFALLNRGEHIWGVGGSDSHTIADPIGQSRTYVAANDENPGAINLEEAIRAMKAGNMSVSYGMFGEARIGSARMGQLARPGSGEIAVNFRVSCPDWVKARKAILYVNGSKVAEQELTMTVRTPLSTNVVFKIPAPSHDAYVVCAAYGDGVKDASWKTAADYTLAITNPIFVDGDGDGKYSSPHETALALLQQMNPVSIGSIEKAIAEVDSGIGVQLLSDAKSRLPAGERKAWEELVVKLSERGDFYSAFLSGK